VRLKVLLCAGGVRKRFRINSVVRRSAKPTQEVKCDWPTRRTGEVGNLRHRVKAKSAPPITTPRPPS
jgi:hypothetical protein